LLVENKKNILLREKTAKTQIVQQQAAAAAAVLLSHSNLQLHQFFVCEIVYCVELCFCSVSVD